jgi:hypothetical protein
MAKENTEPTREELIAQDLELTSAILKANESLQGGSSMFRDRGGKALGGNHYSPYSQSLGMGGSQFQDGNHTQIIKIMREADKAYREIGIVRNVIDLMTDFTSEGLNVHHPVAAQERFYRAWMNKVAMEEVAKQTLRGLYKWANVGIFRFWGKIKPKTRKEMMAKARELFAQGKDKEAVKAFFREDTTFKKGFIPVRYSCLPPFKVRIFGSLLFNTRDYYYAFAENDRQKLVKPDKLANPYEKKLIKNLPDSLKERINRDGQIQLPHDNFTMVHFKRDCSRVWADPLVLPILNDLRFKLVLRRMDISVAESIINPITIFKLGDTPNGFAPTKERFQNLASLLKTPSTAKNLVWDDLISVEQHIVDAKEVFASEKYKEVDLDILNGLGVSTVLINGGISNGGKAGGGGNAFLSVRGLLERLEDGRQEFMKFLNAELNMVRLAMGWKKMPKITWDQMSLRDEAAEKRIAIELRDRKIISNETLLDFLGMDNEIEMARKVREEKQTEKFGVPQSVGPFEEQVRVQKDEDPQRLALDMNEKMADKQLEHATEQGDKQMEHNEKLKDKEITLKKQQVSNTTAPKSGPGRPSGKGDPDSRKQKKRRSDIVRPAKSSVNADLIEQSLSNRAVVEHYLKPRILESIGKSNLRQLTKDEKVTYEQLIQTVWAFSSPHGTTIKEEWVVEMADQVAHGASVSGDPYAKEATDIYRELVLQYRNENLKTPNMHARQELFAEAQILSEN